MYSALMDDNARRLPTNLSRSGSNIRMTASADCVEKGWLAVVSVV
jgi:hypothetical protein